MYGLPTEIEPNPFAELRSMALNVKREDLDLPPLEDPDAFWGVILEWHMAGTEVVVVTFTDGTTSVYRGYGGGVIGGGEHESVRVAAAALIEACKAIVGHTELSTDAMFPAKRRYRITLRTDAGWRCVEADIRDVRSKTSPLQNVFHTGHGVITALRHHS